jgi:hypothetical protein
MSRADRREWERKLKKNMKHIKEPVW